MFGKIIARKIAEKVTRNEKLNEYFRRFIMLWVMCTLKISSCSIDAKTRRIVKYEKKKPIDFKRVLFYAYFEACNFLIF